MVLQETEKEQIISFVKQEPQTIQDIARLLGRSWLTANSYVNQIQDQTGLLRIKTFRQGSRGALKIVFYNHPDAVVMDDVKQKLYSQLLHGRRKTDFDFMDIFQFIPQEKKKAFTETYHAENIAQNQGIIPFLRGATKTLCCFSGNLSFLILQENKRSPISVFEELLAKGVHIKILCRVNVASLRNISLLLPLLQQYPSLLEIKHTYQPLRGFIIDDTIARFKDEETPDTYKQGELQNKTRIFYEIYDSEWIAWLQKTFWNIFRSSIDYQARLQEIELLR